VLRHDVEIERVRDESRVFAGSEALDLTAALAEFEGLLGNHPAARHTASGEDQGQAPADWVTTCGSLQAEQALP
jgi:hypothetical protein